jgi:hypothetical protein
MRDVHLDILIHRALEINAKNVMIIARSVTVAPTIALLASQNKSFPGLTINVWTLAPKV